jgi:antitoxin component YwqK of YwqJK toxin-antitoxin module
MDFITTSDIFSLVYTRLNVDDISSLYSTCKDIKNIIKNDGSFIYEKCVHVQPHGPVEERYENGQIKSLCSYIDGKEEGLMENWYENGVLSKKCFYKNGINKGVWETWHENGKISCRCFYKNGKVKGKWQSWHENGDAEWTFQM